MKKLFILFALLVGCEDPDRNNCCPQTNNIVHMNCHDHDKDHNKNCHCKKNCICHNLDE